MNGTSTLNGRHQGPNSPILVLEPVNDTFALKSLELPENTRVKIGRQTGVATAPHPSNGYFDSKVLSRVHAEVWSESGKVFIRDLKSSNGTFLNGRRLCPENTESESFELNQNDNLEFGIDIMDENGVLLHEKVSCKIYISRMPYPTPGSSPQDSHAKIKSTSPTGSSVNSVKTNSVSVGGQSENIDLIISRLQNELVRSQEISTDLSFLKHGLGELERAIFVNVDETESKNKDSAHLNGQPSSDADPAWINYEKLLEQRDQEHAAEMTRLVECFKGTEVEMLNQHERELERVREELETSRRCQEQASEALDTTTTNMNTILAAINSAKEENRQLLENAQKEKEMALAALKAEHQQLIDRHQEEISRLVLEADAEKEELVKSHKRELAEAIAQATSGGTDGAQTALDTLKEELCTLRQAKEAHIQTIEALTKENKELLRQLHGTKAELEVQQPTEAPESPELTLNATSTPSHDNTMEKGLESSTGMSKDSSTGTNPDQQTIPKESDPLAGEVSWSQFAFPMGARNHTSLDQPSTLLLSGAFMFIGLGVYMLWHKVGVVEY
ncbi:MAG: hypothetical protein J3Q66DRAFT_35136 [Benniella sp.]|nr:MAG: hypothetical protein J3Q66DRAFT_35136 [Benniella sp.]